MRRRLVLVVAATTGLVVVAFAIPLAALVRDVAHDRAITAAERDAAALAPVLAVTQDPELIAAAVIQTPTGSDGRLSVFLDEGQVGDDAEVDARALSLARDGSQFRQESGDGAEIYSPVITGDGSTTVVRARVPSALLDEGVSTAWSALAAVAIVLVVAGWGLADLLARSLTRDVDELAATARALAGGDARARARRGGVREIADVSSAINSLADRIDELRAAERERVADLSHRLRTPLTVLRLEADRAGIPALSEGVDRLERDITRVVRDARRPLRDGIGDESCDLALVAEDRIAFWNALAEDDGRRTSAAVATGPVLVALPEDEVVAVIDALVTNVFTHTPDGVGYEIRLDVDDETARFVVSDEGGGIVDIDAVTARGVSGTGSSGLGLDIVRHAATRAGGAVRFGARDGGGLEVVVELPLLPRSV